MAIKPAPTVYLFKELSNLLSALGPEHKFNTWMHDMKLVLKGNMLAGDAVPKRQIPSHYREKFGLNNLYRYTILKATGPATRCSAHSAM